MKATENFERSLARLLICSLLISSVGGCSSLGLSVWPAQFQLLSKTKALAACAPLPSGMPHELSKFELPNYFIEPGDRILIEPINLDSDISSVGDQKVQVDGSVDIGKYGRIRVTGMTVEEVEQAIEKRIATFGDSESVNVQLVESNAAEVYVIGEVGSPAAYPIDGHEHVLDAILRAGGLTSKASPCQIILVRPTSPDDCRVVLPVCYRQITQLGDVTTNYQLQPGDRIVVGSRSFWEELSWRKQTQSCDRCCRSCCVECQPTRVQYQSRFATRLLPFRLPIPNNKLDGNNADGDEAQDNPTPGADSYFLPPESLDRNSENSKDDLALPPLNEDEPPKSDTPDAKDPAGSN